MQFAFLALLIPYTLVLQNRNLVRDVMPMPSMLNYYLNYALSPLENYKPGSTDNLGNHMLNVTLLSVVRPVSAFEVGLLLLQTSDPTGEVLQ